MTPFEFCRDLRHQKIRFPGLSCGVVCVILRLAVSAEHRLMADRQTHDHGIYRASMASRGKNGTIWGHLNHLSAKRLGTFGKFCGNLRPVVGPFNYDPKDIAFSILAAFKAPLSFNKNSSGDEIANVNFLRQHRTCRGQRLRPFNEFVNSTKRLRQKRYTLPTCLEMDSPVQSASHNKWTRPSVKETHQATWA